MTLSRNRCIVWIWGCLLACCQVTAKGNQETWPTIESVPRQPTLAQLRRLMEAAEHLGHPLPPSVVDRLGTLWNASDDATLARELQEILDPLCGLSIAVRSEGAPQVVSNSLPIETTERGWSTVLIKVANPDGLRSRLRIESPQAKPLPHARPDEIDSRWLELSLPSGQPLSPYLSGTPLEYRWLEIYVQRAGEHTALLNVAAPLLKNIPDATKESSIIAHWQFEQGTAGWKAMNQVTLTSEKGSLLVQGKGDDPFLGTTLEQPAKPGKYVFRFWARAEEPGIGQLFWWTDQRPQADGSHQIGFSLQADQEALYEIPFEDDASLTGLRLDPNGVPGTIRIDWMELSYAEHGNEWGKAEVRLRTRPATAVTFRIRDAAGLPSMACFEIVDSHGRVHPPQSKRLAPDFFFQRQIYRADGESIHLPAGSYIIRCSRGPESILETHQLVVEDDPVDFHYHVRRWIDPSKRGYWSGDHHIHAAGCAHYENPTQGVMPADMLRHCMGEDLKVGCCLTWGPCFDFQKQFFTGRPDDQSQYPYLLRYDVEVSGFGSHESGHLNLLRLHEQIPPGGDSKDHWPTLGLNTLRWAKRQGAICGPAHSAIGLTRLVDRLPGTEGLDGPGRLPNYDIPAFDGIGANEFIMNVTHKVPGPQGSEVPAIDFISTMNTDRVAEWNLWYHVLNCGLPVRASGETDFPCISGERVGLGRVYVKIDGLLGFDQWCEGLAAGRSYVSDGRTHLMDFKARDFARQIEREVGTGDGQIQIVQGDALDFTLTAAVRNEAIPLAKVEWIVNGFPVKAQEIPSDGTSHDLTFHHQFERSGWVAARIFPTGHTNPIFVIVDGKPILEAHSAAWCLRCVETCRRAKLPLYREDERATAEADYAHAIHFFRRLLEPETR